MRIHHCAASLALAFLASSPSVAAPPQNARSASRTVVMHTGRIDASNASAFADMLSLNLDRTIGLRITIAPNREGDKYSVSRDDRGYTIVGDDEFEAVIQGGQGRRGRDETVDGFFRVMNGGMHQGIVSYGLKPVPRPQINAGRPVVVVPRPLR
jgi:hypothetical protein